MIASGRGFKNKDDLEALFAVLKQYDLKAIDTAQFYGDSEELLGSVNAGSQFIIDTKWKGGFAPGSPTEENIVKTAEESMQRLKMDKVSQDGTCSILLSPARSPFSLLTSTYARSISSTSTPPTPAFPSPPPSQASTKSTRRATSLASASQTTRPKMSRLSITTVRKTAMSYQASTRAITPPSPANKIVSCSLPCANSTSPSMPTPRSRVAF